MLVLPSALVGGLLLCVVGIAAQPSRAAISLDVTIYYEALCWDSQVFISSLVPYWRANKEHINLELVPYGKAVHNKNNKTGAWDISCQHGPAECRLNKVHACLLNQTSHTDQAIEVIACHMQTTTHTLEQCVTTATPAVNLAAARECAGSTLGTELFVQHGDRTRGIGGLSFVPSIAVNQVFDYDAQRSLLYNFETTFCGIYRQTYGVEMPTCAPVQKIMTSDDQIAL